MNWFSRTAAPWVPVGAAIALLAAITPFEALASEDHWHPLEIEVWSPPFSPNKARADEIYTPLDEASKKWKICASIPHLKDPYWTAVNFGLIDQARTLDIGLRLFEAGGYGNLEIQRKQISECMATGADALIIGGINADRLSDLVADYTRDGKTVIDLINGINSDALTARTAVDFWDMGFLTGHYLATLEENSDQDVAIAWFPGPEGAGWVSAGDAGFKEGLKNSKVKIVASAMGDTGRSTQKALVQEALKANPDIRYIAGTAVTANAAIDVLRREGLSRKVKILSYYYGPGIHRSISRGNIIAAPTDLPALQARMAVDTAVRALEKKPYFRHFGPKVTIIDKSNIREFDTSTSLPPKGFRPIFSVNDW